MSAQAVTILSGIVLLLVFGLVGWNLRRRTRRGDDPKQGRDESS